jgi:glycosyltransferase involved in cell wall biosynthesis
MTTRRRRLLSISHSYGVALNRRLADAMARADGWDVVAAAPSFFHGDLRPIPLEPAASEACRVEAIAMRATRHAHVMTYGHRLRELLAERWDVVHCWEEPYVFAGAQVARWTAPGAALVFATFQNISKRYPPPFNWIERYSMRRADGWIAFGRSGAQALAGRPAYGRKPGRVIPIGVDTVRFRPDAEWRTATRRELGWTDEDAVVGFVGRFVPEKGVGLLMAALDAVDRPWRALLVGGGPLAPAIDAWAARHPGRVRRVSSVPHDDVPRYLNAMDVLCSPSQTTARWREQFGRMLVEAFACGVAVVGSDSGEIPHVVGDAGVIVPEGDPAAWTRAVSDLLRDADRRRDLGVRGLRRARAVYDWAHVARQHLEFFDELLGY